MFTIQDPFKPYGKLFHEGLTAVFAQHLSDLNLLGMETTKSRILKDDLQELIDNIYYSVLTFCTARVYHADELSKEYLDFATRCQTVLNAPPSLAEKNSLSAINRVIQEYNGSVTIEVFKNRLYDIMNPHVQIVEQELKIASFAIPILFECACFLKTKGFENKKTKDILLEISRCIRERYEKNELECLTAICITECLSLLVTRFGVTTS